MSSPYNEPSAAERGAGATQQQVSQSAMPGVAARPEQQGLRAQAGQCDLPRPAEQPGLSVQAEQPGLAGFPGPAQAGGSRPSYGHPASHWQPGTSAPWKQSPDGTAVFRRLAPLVLWWVWVAFAIFNLVQVVIPDHDYFSAEMAAGLLALTGVAYAAALRPRLVADDAGVVVMNPFRDHVIRWGAVRGVYLGDSVELSCAREEPRKDKTIYCWALYSGRRSRLKSQQLGVRSWSRMSQRSAPAAEPAATDPAQLMAAELSRRSNAARQAGVPAATLESRWAWLPVAAIVVPAAALAVLLLVG